MTYQAVVNFIISFFIIGSFEGCKMIKNEPSIDNAWGPSTGGLQCRISLPDKEYKKNKKIKIKVEIKNISGGPITLFDFQDYPEHWRTSASYLRGMLVSFSDDGSPAPYHMLSKNIEKYVVLKPGEVYSFDQFHNASGNLYARENLKMVYDTRVVEHYWPGEYWQGRFESNTLKITIK